MTERNTHMIPADLQESLESLPIESFGPLGAIFGVDQPASSIRTRTELGWEPTHPGLLKDLERVGARVDGLTINALKSFRSRANVGESPTTNPTGTQEKSPEMARSRG